MNSSPFADVALEPGEGEGRPAGPHTARAAPHRATLAAQSGATIAELMARLGHTTPAMAMRYQHAAAERDAEIARRLSQLADGAKEIPT